MIYVGYFILFIIVIFFTIIIYLMITEYRPKNEQILEINETFSKKNLKIGETLKIISWNIGFAGLGENADFFKDGGKKVITSSLDEVNNNIEKISSYLSKEDLDFYFLQEIDRNSDRSYRIDQLKEISIKLKEYCFTFASNFKVSFIPYPYPMLGKVDSGIATFSKYKIRESKRIQLPIPFKWPLRMANLKRCLLISRIDIENSNKQLVLINLHLEAYDSGKGKILQTNILNEYVTSEVEKGNYVIAGGDFNQIFSNIVSPYPLFANKWKPGKINIEEFSKQVKFLMDTKTPTCRSLDKAILGKNFDDFQFYIIDGFIVSNNIFVNRIETKDLKFKNSDHNPVFLEFTLS